MNLLYSKVCTFINKKVYIEVHKWIASEEFMQQISVWQLSTGINFLCVHDVGYLCLFRFLDRDVNELDHSP